MEGPHGPGFVLSDCHSNSSSVPHLVIPPLKRRQNAHLNFVGSSLCPGYHFTITWKLPWEFSTRHCTSGWRREKCKTWVGWNQVGPIQSHLESAEVVKPSQEPWVWESTSGGVNLGLVFRKFSYFALAKCFRRKSGFRLLFLWRSIKMSSVRRRQRRLGPSSSHSWGCCLWPLQVGFPNFGRYL